MSGEVRDQLSLERQAAALGKSSTTAWAVDDPASFQKAVRIAFAHQTHDQLLNFIVHLALEAELLTHEADTYKAKFVAANAGVSTAQLILRRQPMPFDRMALKRMIDNAKGRPDSAAKGRNLAGLKTLLQRRVVPQVNVSDVAAMLRGVYGNETQAEVVELAGLAAKSKANSDRAAGRHNDKSGEALARTAVQDQWRQAKPSWLTKSENRGAKGWAEKVGVPFLEKHETHKYHLVSVRRMAEFWLKGV